MQLLYLHWGGGEIINNQRVTVIGGKVSSGNTFLRKSGKIKRAKGSGGTKRVRGNG